MSRTPLLQLLLLLAGVALLLEGRGAAAFGVAKDKPAAAGSAGTASPDGRASVGAAAGGGGGGGGGAQVEYVLEHSLEQAARPVFVARSSVSLSFAKLARVGSAQVEAAPLAARDAAVVRRLLADDPEAVYRVRLVPAEGNALAETGPAAPPAAFVRLCALAASDFRELVVLHTDIYGHIASMDYRVPVPECTGDERLPEGAAVSFRTKAKLTLGRAGETPNENFTPAAIKEKAAAAEVPQTFWQKYWKYIVPAGIFLLLNAAVAPPEEGGSGGGGGGGGGGGRR